MTRIEELLEAIAKVAETQCARIEELERERARLRRALLIALVPLEGLHAAVEWELAPAVKTTIADAVQVGRAALAG